MPLLSRPANGWTGCVNARFLDDSTENHADLGIDYPTALTPTQMNDRTKLAAEAAKDSGIIIHAIQFGYDDGTQSALMKEIASGPSSPYCPYAPDAAALQTAFQEIGNHLAKLRLSK